MLSSLDQFRIPAMLIQDGAGHGAHAVADQAVLETHTFQRYVGSLAVGVGAWISVRRKHVLPVAAVGLVCLQQRKCLFRQWDGMRAPLFHALRGGGGMVQIRLSKSMSTHRVVSASAGRVMVCNCHSIRQRVVLLVAALAISRMGSGSSSGDSDRSQGATQHSERSQTSGDRTHIRERRYRLV